MPFTSLEASIAQVHLVQSCFMGFSRQSFFINTSFDQQMLSQTCLSAQEVMFLYQLCQQPTRGLMAQDIRGWAPHWNAGPTVGGFVFSHCAWGRAETKLTAEVTALCSSHLFCFSFLPPFLEALPQQITSTRALDKSTPSRDPGIRPGDSFS